MKALQSSIARFIKEQNCATVCCVDTEHHPYCFNCFYAFNSEEGLLYFKSSSETHHARVLKNNYVVAGTILPDKLVFMQLQGIQFEGEIVNPSESLLKEASHRYHHKYPFALAMPGSIWIIRVNSIKFTNNKNGLGGKEKWMREAVSINK